MTKRTQAVYGLLAAVWCLVLIWQALEHYRVRESARAAVIHRSKDIANIISGVISSATFRGIVVQDRLESALNRLVKPGELLSAALLNASNEVVAYVGEPVDAESTRALPDPKRWRQKSVTFVHPVDLSPAVSSAGEASRPTILMPRRDPPPRPPDDGRFRPGGEGRPRPPDDDRSPSRPESPPRTNPLAADAGLTAGAGSISNSRPDRADRSDRDRPERPDRRSGRSRFGPPPWMTEEEFRVLAERRELHGLVLVMSTDTLRQASRQDLWMRSIIGCFATVSVFGLGIAWRHVTKSSDLQLRLLRASAMNTHLKELNLAAAGLAHETRNPLNIIRGRAQMISKQTAALPDIRDRSREIIEETDRVTAQFNEFINYSRPREARRSALILRSVIDEVVRALSYDLEEKLIDLEVAEEQVSIEADEQLLRQALFNLLLNAIQAVDPHGKIEIVASRCGAGEAFLEIRDNGPGVPAENRVDIFKPYFTTHQKGTGLGLAVVKQIVLAHGWEIECRSNTPRGAIFCISHLVIPKSAIHAA